MYIDSIEIENFRCFRNERIDFIHPDKGFSSLGLPRPKLKNVNLLLGDNGLGKSSLLKAIALTCFGPTVDKAGLYPSHLIRIEPGRSSRKVAPPKSSLRSRFTMHKVDGFLKRTSLESHVTISREDDLEALSWDEESSAGWSQVFKFENRYKFSGLFFVGYGSTRRAEQKTQFDQGFRSRKMSRRAQRVNSLFDESYSLVPLSAWLPELRATNGASYRDLVSLLNRILGKGHYRFTGRMLDGDYIFERNGLRVPLQAMSDGYRALISWVSDLMYHAHQSGQLRGPMSAVNGIVMVDEIDLHLHPKWQMTILSTVARALPRVQFIVSSHSPLVVGSLEWMNIIAIRSGQRQSSKLGRNADRVHGLDADQVLLSKGFGLTSSRTAGPDREIRNLALKASTGDSKAAGELLERMTFGSEPKS